MSKNKKCIFKTLFKDWAKLAEKTAGARVRPIPHHSHFLVWGATAPFNAAMFLSCYLIRFVVLLFGDGVSSVAQVGVQWHDLWPHCNPASQVRYLLPLAS